MAEQLLRVLSDVSTGPRVLVGCSGSVATIKVPMIARLLQQVGATVIVLPTRQALHFLTLAVESSQTDIQTYNKRNVEHLVDNINCVSSSQDTVAYREKSKIIVSSGNNSEVSSGSNEKPVEVKAMYCLSCAYSIKEGSYSTASNEITKANLKSESYSVGVDEVSEETCDNKSLGDVQTTSDGTVARQCPWCVVQKLYPDMTIVGDTLEWEAWQARGDPVLHIELRRWAQLLLIAPLSANTMAKLASGLCDNLLSCVARAWDNTRPLLFCPAMNTHMYTHPITARHITQLKELGYVEVAAVCKQLVCGDVGAGAMAEVDTILAAVWGALGDQ